MNWDEVKQTFKDMPAYIADGFRNTCTWWSNAHPALWVIQIVYLAIFIATFYFVVTYTVNIVEGEAMPPKSTFDFWWIAFTPLTQVGTIFLVQGIFSKIARFIIETFNIPNPDEATKT